CFPEHLAELENEELLLFLAGPEGWDVPLDSLANTAATDWTKIRQRMGYVFALFRALHTEPSVFRAPSDDLSPGASSERSHGVEVAR
ncbi:MAG TPA: hypothetical protein VKT77_22295, partial [Chthonomonadaceae bacterium]|nr:hypothetical protein [Chthonomonadaceae bacterium]